MRSAAQLHAEIIKTDHPHLLCVLFTEQGRCAAVNRLILRHLFSCHRRVAPDALIDLCLNIAQLLFSHSLKMRKVKTQPLGRNQRACLLDMRAQALPQHSLQNMRGRVIAGYGLPPGQINLKERFCIGPERTVNNLAHVHNQITGRLDRINDCHPEINSDDLTRVADLPSGFTVKRRISRDQMHDAARTGRIHFLPVTQHLNDPGFQITGRRTP